MKQTDQNFIGPNLLTKPYKLGFNETLLIAKQINAENFYGFFFTSEH